MVLQIYENTKNEEKKKKKKRTSIHGMLSQASAQMITSYTSGIRPRTPETNKRFLTLIAWEYGPNAAGAFSVLTASFLAEISIISPMLGIKISKPI